MSAVVPSTVVKSDSQSLNTLAVENFKEYLRIPSVHPNVNYGDCVKFLQKIAKSLELPVTVVYVKPNKPLVLITWEGKKPNLPSILLTSHMDVVPASQESWTHKPFAAEEVDGKIYGRGTQDTKSVGMQYLEALRRLKLKKVSFIRTIHVSFTPEEELGGKDGIRAFVHTDDFKKLNLGFSIDEGVRSPNEQYMLLYGERCNHGYVVHCPGESGHGSILFENTAGQKVAKLLEKIYEFREGEEKKLKDDLTLSLGDVTTVNLTMLQGGVQSNVVPPEFTITVDCRLSPTLDISTWDRTLKQWCEEAGSDVVFEIIDEEPQIPPTKLEASNPYWVAFKGACDDIYEAHFHLTSQVIRQNIGYWSKENPWNIHKRPLYLPKVTIPLEQLPGNYGFLQDNITSLMEVLLQQLFPQRLITGGGELPYPAKSPNLTIPDFFIGDIVSAGGLELKQIICPAASDSRYIRGLGIPAIGFCPSNNTPELMHSNDEYITISGFLNGIDIYIKILSKVANVEEQHVTQIL